MFSNLFVTLFKLGILITSNLGDDTHSEDQNNSTNTTITGQLPFQIISGFFRKLCHVPNSKHLKIYFRSSICLLYNSAQIGDGWKPPHTSSIRPSSSTFGPTHYETTSFKPQPVGTTVGAGFPTSSFQDYTDDHYTTSTEPITFMQECRRAFLNCTTDDPQVCSTIIYCPVLRSPLKDSTACECDTVALFTCSCTVMIFEYIHVDGTVADINILEVEIYNAMSTVRQLICNLNINNYAHSKLSIVCARFFSFELLK